MIIQGDWLERLREMPDESVQCCVTSPPYDGMREYGDCGRLDNFEDGAIELYRVMADGAVACWNIGDQTVNGSESLTSCKQKIFFKERCGFRIHDTMIYEKLNFSAPESVRYHQTFEYIFVLSKGKPHVWNPIKDRKNVTAGLSAWGKNGKREKNGIISPQPKTICGDVGMRTNVWRGKTRGQEEGATRLPHPAMMPKWLARDLILSFSNAGDTILDPFCGSGTTGMVAIELGRKFIGIELNPEYIKLAEQRCNVTPGLALA